jgi:hypothetical protein
MSEKRIYARVLVSIKPSKPQLKVAYLISVGVLAVEEVESTRCWNSGGRPEENPY